MGTASLRIKFTPLFKNCVKNESKCCLEIVPEVTCIQNLDKIEWKEKSEIIEYTIPMTYKVILRKQLADKDTNNDLEKIYHSCVDLLPPSSLTCINLGSGDMTTMFSDTFISSSFKANLESEKTVKSNSKLKLITNSEESLQRELVDVSNIITPDQLLNDIGSNPTSIDIQFDSTTRTTVDASTSYIKVDNIEKDGKNLSVVNIANSISQLELSKENKPESLTFLSETVTEICTAANINNEEHSLKLSLTPICSIDTNEKHFHLLSWNPAIYPIFKPQKMKCNTSKLNDLRLENDIKNITNNSIQFYDNGTAKSSLYKEREFKRERPEVKVANFMKKMETEIRPLKVMLHDILQKCSNLGLIKNEKYSIDSVVFQNVPNNNQEIVKYCRAEKQARCNRVVYSVVFDG